MLDAHGTRPRRANHSQRRPLSCRYSNNSALVMTNLPLPGREALVQPTLYMEQVDALTGDLIQVGAIPFEWDAPPRGRLWLCGQLLFHLRTRHSILALLHVHSGVPQGLTRLQVVHLRALAIILYTYYFRAGRAPARCRSPCS